MVYSYGTFVILLGVILKNATVLLVKKVRILFSKILRPNLCKIYFITSTKEH
jgi:hypothetical protein